MPSINLRLTEEQHAELKRWACEDSRSVQREIIFRLFSPYVVHLESDEQRAALAYPLANADAQSERPTVQPLAADPNLVSWNERREAKPDFGSKFK